MSDKKTKDRMIRLDEADVKSLSITGEPDINEMLFLSDRCGEFTDVDELRMNKRNASDFEFIYKKMESVINGLSDEQSNALLGFMRDEVTFIAMKNGELGIHFETEYLCLEGNDIDDESDVRRVWEDIIEEPSAKNVMNHLARQYRYIPLVCPNAQVSVTQGAHVPGDRAALMAFVPLKDATHAEMDRLMEAFLSPDNLDAHIERAILRMHKQEKMPANEDSVMGI